MTKFVSDVQGIVNGPAYGQPLLTRVPANKLNGRIRIAEFTFTAPNAGAAPAIADQIIWGKLPTKARILGHLTKMYWTAGTAACTLNLGDNIVAARHLAATAITAAGSAVCEAAAISQTSTANTTLGSNQLTGVTSQGAYQYGAVVTGAGIPAGTTVTGITGGGNTFTVALSNVATATGAAVALTVAGGSYVTQDDTNSAASNYGSTTDDCTLVSTVAGAQIANNQVITLKVAYVQD